MKTKTYRAQNVRCKSYLKPVGSGFEVGFIFGSKTIFVGNFVHRGEATRWFTQMNKGVRTFSRRYTVGSKFPSTWFGNFLSAFLYRNYYSFVNGVVAKHQRESLRMVNTGVRKYKRIAKNWEPSERKSILKAA